MAKRYQNMTGGCTLFEAGRMLGTLFAEETVAALTKAGVRPCGGTMDRPRFDRRLVEQLAQIRASHKAPETGKNEQ